MAQKFIELPCGSKIRFGSYCVESEGTHQIRWIKMNSSDTTILAEHIEDFRAFDAREPNNPNTDRASYGNNQYSLSNIDRFLNSRDERWYSPSHEYDNPPTGNAIRNNTS